MVKTYCGLMPTFIPPSQFYQSFFSASSPCSLPPQGQGLAHTSYPLPVRTHHSPPPFFFFFALFLKNIYSYSTVLISLIALIVAIYLHLCVWLFDPCLSPLLDCKHIRILDVLDHVVSQGLHSVLPQKRCQ